MSQSQSQQGYDLIAAHFNTTASSASYRKYVGVTLGIGIPLLVLIFASCYICVSANGREWIRSCCRTIGKMLKWRPAQKGSKKNQSQGPGFQKTNLSQSSSILASKDYFITLPPLAHAISSKQTKVKQESFTLYQLQSGHRGN